MFSLPNRLVIAAAQPLYIQPEGQAVSWLGDILKYPFRVEPLIAAHIRHNRVPEDRLNRRIRDAEPASKREQGILTRSNI